jgi:hypothetical protein
LYIPETGVLLASKPNLKYFKALRGQIPQGQNKLTHTVLQPLCDVNGIAEIQIPPKEYNPCDDDRDARSAVTI